MAKGAKDGVFDKIKSISSEIKGIIDSIMDSVVPFTQGEDI
jgi:hypothetical protein